MSFSFKRTLRWMKFQEFWKRFETKLPYPGPGLFLSDTQTMLITGNGPVQVEVWYCNVLAIPHLLGQYTVQYDERTVQ